MPNDLVHFLLVTFCLFGSITALLFLLAAVDLQTDRHGVHGAGRGAEDSAFRVRAGVGGRVRE